MAIIASNKSSSWQENKPITTLQTSNANCNYISNSATMSCYQWPYWILVDYMSSILEVSWFHSEQRVLTHRKLCTFTVSSSVKRLLQTHIVCKCIIIGQNSFSIRCNLTKKMSQRKWNKTLLFSSIITIMKRRRMTNRKQ